jgi:hypothetical protein
VHGEDESPIDDLFDSIAREFAAGAERQHAEIGHLDAR